MGGIMFPWGPRVSMKGCEGGGGGGGGVQLVNGDNLYALQRTQISPHLYSSPNVITKKCDPKQLLIFIACHANTTHARTQTHTQM